MNHRDVWFVGLLALAYLYLDSPAPAARWSAPHRHRPGPLPPREDPSCDTGREASGLAELCPRDLGHVVSVRGDGAKWCHSCDEAFYPAAI